MLHIAWVGDSQVALGKNGAAVKLMDPHKPDREVCFCVMLWIDKSGGGFDETIGSI